MFKKIIALTLITCSLLSCVCVYAEQSSATFGEPSEWTTSESYIDDVYKYDLKSDDNKGSQESYGEYENEIKDILSLGIMKLNEKGEIEPDSKVSVQEFAQILDAMFYDGALSDTISKIKDDSKVSISEVIEAFVDGLGYKMDADSKGYYVVANDIGITKGISLGNLENHITCRQMAKLAYNALDVPMCVVVSTGDVTEYRVDDSKTILSERLKAVEVKGFVNSVYGMNIFPGDSAKSKEIIIDGAVYSYDNDDYKKLIGKRVRGYAKLDNTLDVKELIALREDDRYSSVTYDIKRDIDEIKNNSVSFKDSEEETTEYDLDDIKYLNYNGDRVSVSQFKTLIDGVNSGTVTFTQSEKSGVFDVAIIKSYSTYVIKSIATDENEIYPYYNLTFNGNKSIKFNKRTNIGIYNENGETIKFDDIKSYDVVSVYGNSDMSYVEMYVSGKTVSGDIKSIDKSGTDIAYEIGDKSFELSTEFSTALANPDNNLPTMEVGLNGTFYISYDGRIAGMSAKLDSIHLGYMKACMDDGKKLDNKYAVRLFTDEGKWKVYYLKDKLTLDGVKSVEASTVPRYIEMNVEPYLEYLNGIAGNTVHPLIRYRLNDKGEITFLDTMYDTPDEADDAKRMRYVATVNDKDTWSSGFSWEKTRYHFTDKTKMFSIPADTNNKDKFKAISNNYINALGSINVSFYSVDDYLCAEYGILEETPFNIGSTKWQNNSLLVVDSVVTIHQPDDEEDPVWYKIKGRTWDSKVTEVEWKLSKDYFDHSEMPKKGCIYRYFLSSGKVRHLNLLVDDGVMPVDFLVRAGDTGEIACGVIKFINNEMVTISLSDKAMSWKLGNASVMLYDKQTRKTSKIDRASLMEGDRVIIYGDKDVAGAIAVAR